MLALDAEDVGAYVATRAIPGIWPARGMRTSKLLPFGECALFPPPCVQACVRVSSMAMATLPETKMVHLVLSTVICVEVISAKLTSDSSSVCHPRVFASLNNTLVLVQGS